MKFFYICSMIMETLKAIVNVKRECPICGCAVQAPINGDFYVSNQVVHSNEYYTHYVKNGKHYVIRETNVFETQMSLC